RTAERAASSSGAALAFAVRAAAPGSASAGTAGALVLTGHVRLAGEQCQQLLFRDDAVLVRVGAIEEAVQPRVGQFVLGELAILVRVKDHELGDEIVGGDRPRAALVAASTALALTAGRLGRGVRR